jgi:uncharacterized membrane protein
MFGAVSLPLATVAVFYFINHRYDGTPLWNVQSLPGLHTALWIANFVSFLFLYPSTFNLLEVAAVDKPKLHLWETGVTRITRHPQAWGQLLWCVAHTIWIGNSFMVSPPQAVLPSAFRQQLFPLVAAPSVLCIHHSDGSDLRAGVDVCNAMYASLPGDATWRLQAATAAWGGI